MMIQISSGQGPVECEFAVGKLRDAILAEYPDAKVQKSSPGKRRDCYKSVILECAQDLSHLEGSVLWVCASPFRPGHKRKNWYVDVSVVGKAERLDFDGSLVRFETFRSSGKGGQHVNKVETGVRAIYLPLGLSVESQESRSQHLNKQQALDRLCNLVAGMNQKNLSDNSRLNWLEHTRLERGNPVRVYEGMDFRITANIPRM